MDWGVCLSVPLAFLSSFYFKDPSLQDKEIAHFLVPSFLSSPALSSFSNVPCQDTIPETISTVRKSNAGDKSHISD